VDLKEREGVLISTFMMGLPAKISWSELLRLVLVPELDVAEVSPKVSNPAQNGRARSGTLNLQANSSSDRVSPWKSMLADFANAYGEESPPFRAGSRKYAQIADPRPEDSQPNECVRFVD